MSRPITESLWQHLSAIVSKIMLPAAYHYQAIPTVTVVYQPLAQVGAENLDINRASVAHLGNDRRSKHQCHQQATVPPFQPIHPGMDHLAQVLDDRYSGLMQYHCSVVDASGHRASGHEPPASPHQRLATGRRPGVERPSPPDQHCIAPGVLPTHFQRAQRTSQGDALRQQCGSFGATLQASVPNHLSCRHDNQVGAGERTAQAAHQAVTFDQRIPALF